MSRRRVIVAFEEVESATSRVVGQFFSPTFADGGCAARPPAEAGSGVRLTWDVAAATRAIAPPA